MTVLIVEDDMRTAEFVAKGMRQAGYCVEHAADGLAGLTLACSSTFDAAIIDIMLPKLDGLTLIQELRQRGIRTPVIVLSRNPISFPPSIPETVIHSSESPSDLLERVAEDGVKHVYVDGGRTIQSFLAADLVDTITVTVVPVILGSGIRLFGPTDTDTKLVHVRTVVFDFGFVQTTYRVTRE